MSYVDCLSLSLSLIFLAFTSTCSRLRHRRFLFILICYLRIFVFRLGTFKKAINIHYQTSKEFTTIAFRLTRLFYATFGPVSRCRQLSTFLFQTDLLSLNPLQLLLFLLHLLLFQCDFFLFFVFLFHFLLLILFLPNKLSHLNVYLSSLFICVCVVFLLFRLLLLLLAFKWAIKSFTGMYIQQHFWD